MNRFRQFLNTHDFTCQLREVEAAPPIGGASPPPTPDAGGDTTNQFHSDMVKQNLDIEDGDYEDALENGVQTLWFGNNNQRVPDYGWGFVVKGPLQAEIKSGGYGNYKVTFLLSQCSRKKFFHPDGVTYYDPPQWPVPDETVNMTKEELADAMVQPFAGGGGGGAPPMGGGAAPGGPMAPMGGGAPPMGGPPMGGM